MTAIYMKNFKIAAVFHGAAVVLLVVVSMWQGWFRRKPEAIMVEFMVALPPVESSQDSETAEPAEEPDPLPDPSPDPEDIPEPEPEPEPDPEPPKLRKKPIKISNTRVRKVLTPPTRAQPQLTEEEIRERLRLGATVGDHTTAVPPEDQRCKLLIRRRFYEAWLPPSKAEAGDAVVAATVRFALDGRIVSRQITKLSGIASLDDSVQAAVNAVQKIDGLTPDFLRRHPTVTIDFVVTR